MIDFNKLTQDFNKGLNAVPPVSGRFNTLPIIESLLFTKLMAETGVTKIDEALVKDNNALLTQAFGAYQVDAQSAALAVEGVNRAVDEALERNLDKTDRPSVEGRADFAKLIAAVQTELDEKVPTLSGRRNILPVVHNLLAAKLMASRGVLEDPAAVVEERVRKLRSAFQNYQLPETMTNFSIVSIDAIIERAISDPKRARASTHSGRIQDAPASAASR